MANIIHGTSYVVSTEKEYFSQPAIDRFAAVPGRHHILQKAYRECID